MENKEKAVEQETNNQDRLTAHQLFTAPVYRIHKPEFLETTRKVAKKFIAKRKKEADLNPAYPVYMTESLNFDPDMLVFANYVAQTGWNILYEQGYDMEKFGTYFEAMWCQEHHKNSAMDKHIHGNGAVLTGFYFLDCPKDSSKVIFHDPRDSKVITSLPEIDMTEARIASNMINFIPEEGELFFTNAWLPHSFTKNESKKPISFIHFNIAAQMVPQRPLMPEMPKAEVI
jgi:uncharacterized protein (TIGR02466 family)